MNKTAAITFDEIYQQYKGMVFQLCTGFMKGDREHANDLLQEIFINAWNALPSFRGEASYKTWIYRIAVNTCLQYIRKQKKLQIVPLANIEITAIATDDSSREVKYTMLHSAITQLEDIERLIIIMVLNELDYEEISRVVGISEGNLRVKIHRIKQHLKKILHHEQ